MHKPHTCVLVDRQLAHNRTVCASPSFDRSWRGGGMIVVGCVRSTYQTTSACCDKSTIFFSIVIRVILRHLYGI